MSEAATDTSCLGLTSIRVIWSRGAIRKSPARRAEMISSPKVPSLLISALAWAIVCLASSIADR